MKYTVKITETEIYEVEIDSDSDDKFKIHDLAVEKLSLDKGKYWLDSDGDTEIIEND